MAGKDDPPFKALPVIHQLDTQVVNRIAAGEVIGELEEGEQGPEASSMFDGDLE